MSLLALTMAAALARSRSQADRQSACNAARAVYDALKGVQLSDDPKRPTVVAPDPPTDAIELTVGMHRASKSPDPDGFLRHGWTEAPLSRTDAVALKQPPKPDLITRVEHAAPVAALGACASFRTYLTKRHVGYGRAALAPRRAQAKRSTTSRCSASTPPRRQAREPEPRRSRSKKPPPATSRAASMASCLPVKLAPADLGSSWPASTLACMNHGRAGNPHFLSPPLPLGPRARSKPRVCPEGYRRGSPVRRIRGRGLDSGRPDQDRGAVRSLDRRDEARRAFPPGLRGAQPSAAPRRGARPSCARSWPTWPGAALQALVAFDFPLGVPGGDGAKRLELGGWPALWAFTAQNVVDKPDNTNQPLRRQPR